MGLPPEYGKIISDRSSRKKFLKMRHKFKERMRENSRYYDEEQQSQRIARRLQEQNECVWLSTFIISKLGLTLDSQILDLLYDINESTKIPPHLSYDVRSPTPSASDVPSLEPDLGSTEGQEVEGAHAALREARSELDAGQITLGEYRDTEQSLMTVINQSRTSNPRQNLHNLFRISHTKLPSVPPAAMPADLVDELPAGYLSPVHEEDYLSNLDKYLADTPSDSIRLLPRHSRPTEKEREKDAQLHNPVSVYNWLRAHSDTKPIPHDAEKEAVPPTNTHATEPSTQKPKSPPTKPLSSVGTGSTKPSRKRASGAFIPKPEPEEELLDDEGYVIAGGSEAFSTKGKRKRENDDAYRPKGGSSKSRKRTKGSSGAVVKKMEPEVEEEEDEEDV